MRIKKFAERLREKRNTIIWTAIIVLILSILVVQQVRSYRTGADLLERMHTEEFASATLTAAWIRSFTHDPVVYASKELSSEEIDMFYRQLRDSKFQEKDDGQIPFQTRMRYLLVFYDDSQEIICRLVFYKDELLFVYHRVYTEKDDPIVRYIIRSTDLVDFFDTVLQQDEVWKEFL